MKANKEDKLTKCLTSLGEMRHLEKGWAEYDVDPIPIELIDKVEDFIKTLSIPPTYVCPMYDDGLYIKLDYHIYRLPTYFKDVDATFDHLYDTFSIDIHLDGTCDGFLLLTQKLYDTLQKEEPDFCKRVNFNPDNIVAFWDYTGEINYDFNDEESKNRIRRDTEAFMRCREKD